MTLNKHNLANASSFMQNYSRLCLGSVFINLQIIDSMTSSAPPPIEIKRMSLGTISKGKKN